MEIARPAIRWSPEAAGTLREFAEHSFRENPEIRMFEAK